MKRIIIIDDEPDSLQVMRDVLEEYACRVYAAATGRQGLKLIAEAKPDLVFLDFHLPDGDGEKLLSEIKSEYPRLKVVIGTAYGDAQKREQLRGRGADGFFDKPIDLHAFEKKARQLIGTLSEIRMLIIDDETDFCQTFKDILESDSESKWIVYTANTGEEGIRKVEELMPDLISLDLALNIKGDTCPLSSGLEVYREIKNRGFKIPIVVLGAYIDTSDAEQLAREGVAGAFSKTDLMSIASLAHFLNVLKRIAARGSGGPKARGSDH